MTDTVNVPRDEGFSPVYEAALTTIRNGAPGLSEGACKVLARSINMKVSLLAAAPKAEPEAHIGDPCRKCGVGHDNVEVGPCPADGVVISRNQADAILNYCKNGEGPSGWPTTLWVEVQNFISNIEAALAAQPEAPKVEQEPVAWVAMWRDGSTYGEPQKWPPIDGSKTYHGMMGRTVQPLYTHPAPASDELLAALEPICREADCWPELADDDVLSFATSEGSASPYDIKMGDIRRIAAIAKHKGPQS